MSCSTANRFPNKHHLEDATLEFDFAASMASGVTISQIITASIEVLAGEDPDPSSVLDGVAAASGTRILVPIKDGLPGVSYLFTVEVLLSDGGNPVMQGYITIL